ncbi:hypothetical protein NDA07_20730 [Microcoleus vaginatus DQ-U2]|uniref:hypothetical protein n=1 Tax=Microcoleus vaginatus TaxID=119532 RepID=UPI001688D371|nr:hypothetical protein [Microcoleus sp. FACHB-DQ6]
MESTTCEKNASEMPDSLPIRNSQFPILNSRFAIANSVIRKRFGSTRSKERKPCKAM